jgi:hypothetical protein
MGFCPLQFIGQFDGAYYYGGINCATGGSGSASDSRSHRLGVDCHNILDPIGQCGDTEHVCGCEAEGLSGYVTLKEKFKPAKHTKVIGQCTVVYQDGGRKRKARLFIVRSQPPGKEPTFLRVGLELAPRTALPAEGCFQATLDHKQGCRHCIQLHGVGHEQFHVLVKGRPKKTKGRTKGTKGRAKARTK